MMSRGKTSWLLRVILVIGLAFAVMDFWPHFGAPSFRYNGSDPEHLVWNLGWPLVLFIYDTSSGLHMDPLICIAPPLQGSVVLLVAVVGLLFRWKRRGSEIGNAHPSPVR